MITGLFDNGAMPALERLVQFTGQRHKLLVHNIANVSTPYFQQRDLSIDSFRSVLAKAIDDRQQRTGGPNGPLEMRDTRQLHFGDDFTETRPRPIAPNIMFHDRNNRSLEHLMQGLAENTMTHRAALDILKNELDLLNIAIRERV
ncbi:MAG: hypothetical protein CMJ49_09340 [Planctomycetaceae bacterium]|nr:hypothetical protein [Planctomycetaceae bacterium]